MREEELSPNGRTRILWSVTTGRMSHEIRTPTFIDAASGATLLDFPDSGFDATVRWTAAGFDLDLRHYWRPGTLTISVDREHDCFRFADQAKAEPLESLARRILDRFSEFDQHAPQQPQSTPRERHTLWIALLCAGVGIAVFLAAWL